MSIVKFKHKSYGVMEALAEYWFRYETFDAVDEIGDVYPVLKDDCQSPEWVES